jgi:ABC-2 type transport system ATP-binding protein
VREGTPAELKAALRERRDGHVEPNLEDVYLDAIGRTRERAAGEVQEVTA